MLEGINMLDSTIISNMDNGSGKSRELSKAQGKVVGKTEKHLLQAFKQIQLMCESIGLSRVVCDCAKQFFKKADDENLLKGKGTEAIIAACIYIACKEQKVDRTFKEVCALTKVSKKDIGKCYKLLQPILETQPQAISLDVYVTRFSSALDLTPDVVRGTNIVHRKVMELGLLDGRSPITIIAACLYFVSRLSKNPKTAKEISEIAGCSDSTLKNAFKIILGRKDEVGKGLVMHHKLSELGSSQ
jgi:transcription initiation factor TFIIB